MTPYESGVLLLSKLIETASRRDNSIKIVSAASPPDAINNHREPLVNRTFSLWQRYDAVVGKKDEAGPRVLRMSQRLDAQMASRHPEIPRETDASRNARHYVLIEDDGLFVRDAPETVLNPIDRLPKRPVHVIYKTTSPLDVGPIWSLLKRKYGSSLTVYYSLEDLRADDHLVEEPQSWEKLALEIATTETMFLANAYRAIIPVGLSGAVIMTRNSLPVLVYDPGHQANDWERKRPGVPRCLGKCILASIGLECARSGKHADFVDAVKRGLHAARRVHEVGFAEDPGDPNARSTFQFPYRIAAEALETDNRVAPSHYKFYDEEIKSVAGRPWRILHRGSPGEYAVTATQTVLVGPTIALRQYPIERFGKWSSVDRSEIEGMRAARNLVDDYLGRPAPLKPLCLAVFGDPGSGKSFAIREMAEQLSVAGRPLKFLPCNLSQFESTDQLHIALQRVRDCGIRGEVPLAFWDEFDSAFKERELGWLSHFLAPMQDGEFLENGEIRPIGTAVFIFAGGRSKSLDEFRRLARDVSLRIPDAKATDFVSRLRGFVEIMGPNPRGSVVDDPLFILRRALLLRSIIIKNAPQVMNGDNEGKINCELRVLNALLRTRNFYHGARSMEAIIQMSNLSSVAKLQSAALPTADQLKLHANPDEFFELLYAEPGMLEDICAKYEERFENERAFDVQTNFFPA